MNKITLESFLDFKYLGKLTASPEKTRYAFVASKAELEKNEYHQTLYLGEDDSVTKLRKIGKNNAFIFLDESRLLLNYQKNKQEEKKLKESSQQTYYIYDIDEKTLDFAFELPFPASVDAVVEEGTLLISADLTTEDHVLYEGTEEERNQYLKERKKESAYEDIDQLPYHFNGRDFITGKNKQLFLYDINLKKVTRLMDKGFAVGNYILSEDKSTIYYTGKQDEKVMSFTTRIYAYDIKKSEHRTLYDKLDYNVDRLIDMDGTLVAAAKDMKRYGLNENPDFYTVANDTLTLLASHGESINNTVGTDVRLLGSPNAFMHEGIYYFISTIDDHSELMALSPDGTLETVFKMPGAIDGIVKHKDHAVMIGLKEQRLHEVYQYDFDNSTIKMVSRLNARNLSNRYVAKPQTLSIEGDTHTVKGFVLLPEDYDQNKEYPLILDIHGGPKTVYGQIYYHEMQYWVNEGYIVCFANPRGSDGKGNEFADIRGKYGTIDYEDLMAFTDKVIETYAGVDTTRLFVTGGSYGGFMTNWMVGHTDRFKAAVTQRSISNWISFYGTSDIGYFFASDQTDGHPIHDREKLYEQSPIKYALNVKTPLLFIHSDKDHRCPMEQAQQMYAILKTEGVDTKLVWLKGENHELSRAGKPQARVKRLKEITAWFEKYR